MSAPWEVPRGDETIAEILGADPAILVGKTIASVDCGLRPSDRVEALHLTFSDGSKATIGFWASYAEDASLELTLPSDGSCDTSKSPAGPANSGD